MVSRSWELKNGQTLLGTLTLAEINQPWFICHFTPAAGWDQAEGLFRAQADAVDSADQAQMTDAVGAVRNLPLQLLPQDGSRPITPVTIQIRAHQASFRY
ncbi:hypothetical protein RKD23_007996 [Streptomyces sp. SAI-170]|uniref:hypothetical protein n=1 Tax=Streptomyces sp. SAI-170 TaxID=3377729 RepID=UPI003C7ABFD9